MRRRPRHSSRSSSARVGRTGQRWPPVPRFSWCRSSYSPCFCASICCAASPSERFANERRRDFFQAAARLRGKNSAARAAGSYCDNDHRYRRRDADAALFPSAVFLVVRDHSVRHGDVHHRLEGQGVGPMAQIKVEALEKSFGAFHAVKAASFTVEDGQFLCLLGPSGCGKTTTLRMIAGLELPTAGRIRLDGEEVTMNRASARDIAFVFQLFALYPHMNVRRNIGFPLKCEGIGAAETDRRVVEAARILRISHLLDRPVSGLAGGDRQRVALGRAIVRKPKCFLMDEPLGALDTEMREAMIRELRTLHDRLGATTVYVTHDQLEAMAMADMIAVMNNGVVEQVASPRDIYDRPASLFVADFIGSPPMNFLPFRDSLATGAQAIRLGEGEVAIPAARETLVESDLVLGVRPEHVRFADLGVVRGEVYGSEYLGTTQIVTVTTRYGALKARSPASVSFRIGDNVGLDFRPDTLSIFDKATGRAIRTVLHEGGGHG